MKPTKKATAKAKAKTPKKPTKKIAKKSSTKASISRVDGNPFRAGSAYAAAFSILKNSPAGLARKEFVEQLAAATGKSVKRAGYDAAVLLSAKESPTGPRHRSCREGFWVEKTNDHCKLRTS